jgi:hypothetical protein
MGMPVVWTKIQFPPPLNSKGKERSKKAGNKKQQN